MRMKIINVMAAFGLAATMSMGVPEKADAQMAPRIPMSPPVQSIMMNDNLTYGDMLVKFRALMEGPQNETLQPFDYVTMALFLFQGAKEHGLKAEDSFDGILMAYNRCNDSARRRQIVNNVMEIGKWLPQKVPAAMDMVVRAFKSEEDVAVRLYEVTMIHRMAQTQKSLSVDSHAREVLSQDSNEQVAALAQRAVQMFPEPVPQP